MEELVLKFINPLYYQDIYLLLVVILTFGIYTRYGTMETTGRLDTRQPIDMPHTGTDGASLMLCVFFTLLVGLRPLNWVFVDMNNYFAEYEAFGGNGFSGFDRSAPNKIFDNIFQYWMGYQLDFFGLMLLMCVINFGCTYAACRRLFPQDTAIAFLVFLAAFSTFSYATNGIKAGTAMGIFVLALSYYKNWSVCIPLMLVSYGFHHSMIMPLAAFVVAFFYRNPRLYFFGWMGAVLFAALHITFFQELFASIGSEQFQDEQGMSYLTELDTTDATNHLTGFRPDFILYSAMPVVIGWRAIMVKRIRSDFYEFLLNMYIITNSVWMLCMYASYTNRIAYLSWGLYPFVLIYPLLRENWGENQYRVFSKVVLYHLLFTLLMTFGYYGGYHKYLG